MKNNMEDQNYKEENGYGSTVTDHPSDMRTELANDLSPVDSVPEEKVSFWKLLKSHWVSVLVDCLVFGIFGMGVAFLGPTLFDLGCQTRSDLRQMNWVFFVQLLMTLVGSFSAGILAGRFVPGHILLCIGMTGLPITMFMIPACTQLAGLLVNLMVMGWFMGCIDCVANLRMILRYGANVTPFLQALHFFYGLGAFISPMIASPFLLNLDCSPYIDGFTAIPQDIAEKIGNNATKITVAPQPHKVSKAVRLSHSEEAFFILGAIQLIIAIVVYAVIILERKWGLLYGATTGGMSSMHSSGLSLAEEKGSGEFNEYDGNTKLARWCRCGTKEVVLITGLTSASLFIYDGLQSSYADYIYSYAEKEIKGLKREEGATVDACFWGTFALGRLIAIGLATKFSAAFMLACNIVGVSAAILLTLIWHSSRVAIYVCTCAVGLFLSSMSPTAMSLTEQFININAPITACLVVFAALGETVSPVIVGNLFVTVGPVSFVAFCFTIVLIAAVLYLVLFTVGRDMPKFREEGRSFVWIALAKKPKQGESMEINSTSVKYYSNAEDSKRDNALSSNYQEPVDYTQVDSQENTFH